jgi:hypothetical protein
MRRLRAAILVSCLIQDCQVARGSGRLIKHVEAHLLFPVLHAVIEEFVHTTNIRACCLVDVPRFPPVSVGMPDYKADRCLSFDATPGRLLVWVSDDDSETLARTAISALLARIRELVPRSANSIIPASSKN